MTIYELSNKITNGGMDELFSRIYCNNDMERLRQRARYINAAENFSRLYPQREEIHVFSVPAHTEICGNYTDCQHGCVLSAAVTLDILAIVAYHDEAVIRIKSEEYGAVEFGISDLSDIAENNSELSELISGIISEFAEYGKVCCGFDAYITSDIPVGSGLSSSAAYEVLMSVIINNAGDNKLSAVEIAKIGQNVENKYFEKSYGLIDRLTCSVGGMLAIDLNNSNEPTIHKIDFDFSQSGYSLCIVDTMSSHSNLRDDYNEIVADMNSVAKAMGVDYLGDADEDVFYNNLPKIRGKIHDRAILRAAHFFAENQRVMLEQDALDGGRLAEFFRLVNDSAESSATLLQNMYSPKNQSLMLAFAVSKRYLRGAGAVRVQVGFSGAIQAFVPNYMVNGYIRELDRIFGSGSTHVMGIRNGNMIELFD